MAAPKGNRNAAKAKEWEAAISHALTEYQTSSVQRGLALRSIAKKLIEKALDGELAAMQEIGNRLDGKPKESIEHTGDILHRHSTELTEEELERIATGSGEGAAEQTQIAEQSSPVH